MPKYVISILVDTNLTAEQLRDALLETCGKVQVKSIKVRSDLKPLASYDRPRDAETGL